LWCGGNHLHKNCPEKENSSSTPKCCNWQLAEGETAHPSNYRGYRHAKEMRKNNQYYGWKEVLFKVYYLNHILRSGFSKELKITSRELIYTRIQ
jgi:hypothetical protein